MTDQARLNEARVLAATLDRLTRHPKRVSPSAPWIIPATMIVVAIFALVSLAIKLMMNYLNKKNEKTKDFNHSHASSPDIPTTPEDQTSMATTASMKTRGSLAMSSRRHRSKPPPVSLYQIKQKQSPGSSSKSKTHRAAMKAISRAARTDANRSMSRDSSKQRDDRSDDNNSNNLGDNSPNLSQRSDEVTEEIQAVSPSNLAYGAATSRGNDQFDGPSSSNQPEMHIVQIRDLEDVQHSQPAWTDQPAESEI